MSTAKTYVLLETMDANAPVYQQTADGKRVQVKKIPFHRPTLRQTFQDEDGVNRVIRYKEIARSIYQDEQIEKEKIPANERFTTREYRDIEFRHGTLTTAKTLAQQYLETHPEFEDFKGICDEIRTRKYKLLDKISETKIRNSDTKVRIKAANKVAEMELPELQAMLIRLNGSYFETPNPEKFTGAEAERIEAATAECQNMLWEFIDDMEEPGLNAVLADEEDINIDDRTKVLVGKLINAGKLSFDAITGKISKKDRNGEWIAIREMSTEYSPEERLRLFTDFLNTDNGKALKNDLEKDLDSNAEPVKKMGRPKTIK